MIKSDIINLIQDQIYNNNKVKKSNFTQKNIQLILDTFFTITKESLAKGNKIELRGFGTFDLRVKQERKRINPRTKESVIVEKHSVPHFRPGQALKDLTRKSYLREKNI